MQFTCITDKSYYFLKILNITPAPQADNKLSLIIRRLYSSLAQKGKTFFLEHLVCINLLVKENIQGKSKIRQADNMYSATTPIIHC